MLFLVLLFNLFAHDYSYVCSMVNHGNQSFYEGELSKWASYIGFYNEVSSKNNKEYSHSYSIRSGSNFIDNKTIISSDFYQRRGISFDDGNIDSTQVVKILNDIVYSKEIISLHIFNFSKYYCLIIDNRFYTYDLIEEKIGLDRFGLFTKTKITDIIIYPVYLEDNTNSKSFKELVSEYIIKKENELNNDMMAR